MTAITAVLFDKDGTLFDFSASWGAWAHDFLGSITVDQAQAALLAHSIGYDWHARAFSPNSPVIAGTSDDIAYALAQSLPDRSIDEVATLINRAATRAQMVPAVALHPLMSELKAMGLKIGLATNDSEAAARAHLDTHCLTDFFDFVAGYDSGYGSKPAPGMCHAFIRAMSIDPLQAAMVGDSLHDLHAGSAAGMRRVAVLTGMAGAAELASHADVVLRDIGMLPEWLRSTSPIA